MKMKQSVLAILALGSVASVAQAADVDFYGVLDAAIGKDQHSLSIDSQFPASVNPLSAVKTTVPGSAMGMINGGISDSRLGVKGSQDLGNGMKAFFNLEEGVNLPTGNVNNAAGALAANGGTASTAAANSSLNGQLFNRQAFVGISDESLGSLRAGRNYAPMFDIAVGYDPVQNAQLFSPLGFSGTIGGGGGVSEDTRVDNSLKYGNKFGAFNVGALYKFGGVAGQSSAKSGYALNAGYEEGNLGVQAAYEGFNDALAGASATAANITGSLAPTNNNQVAVTAYNTSAFMLAAKYKINDQATVKAGFETYTLSKPSESLAAATTSYYGQTVAALTNFAGANRTTQVLWIGGDYNFTEQFNLAAGVYNISTQQSADYVATSATNAVAKTGQASSSATYLSLLADYHFTKAIDTYAGLMYGNFSGNGYSTGYYSSNYTTAVGMRYKF